MHIGLISDTHGNLPRTERAVEIFRRRSVQAVLHAGDVGSEAILEALESLGVEVRAVRGNTDLELPMLLPMSRVTLGGRAFVILHGDNDTILENALRSQQFDYLIRGHTHEPCDERHGRTRVINPGAIHRSAAPSVAILDTDGDHLDFVHLPADIP